MAMKTKLSASTSAAALSSGTAAPALDPAAAQAERSAIARFVAAFIAALRAVIALVFGGTVDTFRRDIASARKVAGAAKAVSDHALAAAGKGLEGPARAVDLVANGIGTTLGALLPVAPVGPGQVAKAAVAADDNDGLTPPWVKDFRMPLALLGTQIQLAAQARADGNRVLSTFDSDEASPTVKAWFEGLSRKQYATLAALNPWAIEAHVNAKSDADRNPALPAVSPLTVAPRALGLSDAEMARIKDQARRNLAASRGEVQAMMQRGRPASLDDGEAYETARPRFH